MNIAFGKQSVFVRNLEQMLGYFYSPNQPCYYTSAVDFFDSQLAQQQALTLAEGNWQQAQANAAKPEVVQKARKIFTDLQYEDEKRRMYRWSNLKQAAEALLQLSEGSQSSESQMQSARLLGGLLITSASKKNKALLLEYAYKPCYRALLTLRLLEDLLEQNILKEKQWQQWYKDRTPSTPETCPYRQQLQMPIVMACIIQHSGLLDPAAQQVLDQHSAGSKADRALQPDERKRFLELSQQGSLNLLKLGLGELPYRGNNRAAREEHQQQQAYVMSQLLRFINARPETPLGSLFKVPQAYASIVLPGRSRYNYDMLPKGALMLREGVNRGDYNGVLVDRLFRIVGLFPQGYGVVYTPLGDDGKPQQKYEFAIVNTLYPEKPEHPGCRVVSRNQQYRNTRYNISLSSELNLFFKPARDRLKKLPEDRLKELLNMLFKDGEENYLNVLLPKCWQPASFFSVPENQNLWQNAHQRQN